MKRQLMLLGTLVLVPILFLGGACSDDDDDPTDAGTDTGVTQEERDDFIQDAQDRLDDLTNQDGAQGGSDDNPVDDLGGRDDDDGTLQNLRDDIERELEELRTATEDEWEDAKNAVEELLDRLKREIDEG